MDKNQLINNAAILNNVSTSCVLFLWGYEYNAEENLI